ncbi:MAG: transglutaminase-like cysteine peptidase [Oceanospirillaceae bacterium]|nr:transglutaminase-like cysteine peptidase [Oceanospirillaceae bacterium]
MKLALVLFSLLLAGCITNDPTPFRLGDPVPPLSGCADLRSRGGHCWSMQDTLQKVLDEAHAKHQYVSDLTRYQREDYWIASLHGDCEDFALWARNRLATLGITSDLVYVLTENGGDHMVLSVEGWILDSRHKWLHRRDDLRYDWISIGQPDGRWFRIDS